MTSAECVYLIDTNVLIYAYDARDPDKQAKAIELLDALALSGQAGLTAQILGEFFVNVTRKPLHPLSISEARQSCRQLARSWTVFDVTVRCHLRAIGAVSRHRLSYWDAVLWATAAERGIPIILTEDQQSGRAVESVGYLDPFAPGSVIWSLS